MEERMTQQQHWWVIYIEDGSNDLVLSARGYDSQEAAQAWADQARDIVIIDIAEGRDLNGRSCKVD